MSCYGHGVASGRLESIRGTEDQDLASEEGAVNAAALRVHYESATQQAAWRRT